MVETKLHFLESIRANSLGLSSRRRSGATSRGFSDRQRCGPSWIQNRRELKKTQGISVGYEDGNRLATSWRQVPRMLERLAYEGWRLILASHSTTEVAREISG
jgi:hypothetical protein